MWSVQIWPAWGGARRSPEVDIPSIPAAGASNRHDRFGDQPPSNDGLLAVKLVGFQQNSDHVQFCILVTHCSGLTWRVWRRFSEIVDFRGDLRSDLDDESQMPTLPQCIWYPNFMQVLDADFCENRLTVLQQFFDELLANPTLASQTSVHTLLGVLPPPQPKGLRAIRRGENVYEVEVRPGDEQPAAPVDAYHIVVLSHAVGVRRELVHAVGTDGAQPHTMRIGELEAGKHRVTVASMNHVGRSATVTITVHVEQNLRRAGSQLANELSLWLSRIPKVCCG